MSFKKTLFAVTASVLCASALAACSSAPDITGYYTANQLNNVYYFSPDGNIYENYSEESYSCYEIHGDTIKLYNEDAKNVVMEFDFKETENGFFIGELEYTKIADPTELEIPEETPSAENEEAGATKTPDISGIYEDSEGNTYNFAKDGMVYKNDENGSDVSWLVDGELIVIRTLSKNSSEVNSLEITENGIKIGDTEYKKVTE